MECGIVGLPLSGKSTLFNILTGNIDTDKDHGHRDTIRGVARLNDPRLDLLAKAYNSRKTTPATATYVDVPGVSSRESKPEPYPAQYLAELRGADMLALVVRDFENPVVPLPSGNLDPLRDINYANLEFIINDLDVVERRLARVSKQHDPESRKETSLLECCYTALSEEKPLRDLTFDKDANKQIRSFAFLSLKPLLIVLNLGEENVREASQDLDKLKKEATGLTNQVGWVAVAAGIESEINQLAEGEREPFLADLGFQLPTLNRIIKATFDLLGLITFLTANARECRAWSITAGSTALEAAGTVHNDMARGFIRAEVFCHDELLDAGSLANLKEKGKLRLEGKNYIVQDGDVLNIRFNV